MGNSLEKPHRSDHKAIPGNEIANKSAIHKVRKNAFRTCMMCKSCEKNRHAFYLYGFGTTAGWLLPNYMSQPTGITCESDGHK